MIFVANALHWMDIEPTLLSIARQLKPRGTFVAAMFGIPYFDDEKVRDIFGSMMTHAIEEELRTWKK